MSQMPAIPGRRSVPALTDPTRIFLGWMEPQLADLEPIIDDLRQSVREYAHMMPRAAKDKYYFQNYPLPYQDYCRFSRDLRPLMRELRGLRTGELLSGAKDSWPLRRLLSFGENPKFTPDFYGWVEYLKCLSEPFANAIDHMSRDATIPEEMTEEHTMIVAPSKWGKSELIKTFVHHYALHEELGAVIVIDPHPDMTRQIARWPQLVRSRRAVYIQPGLQPGREVSLNLLDGRGMDINDRRQVSAFWASQIGSLTSELSVPMVRIARHCFHLLLAYGNATLLDLLAFLNAPKEAKNQTSQQRALLQFARRYPDPVLRGFFENDYLSHNEESSRGGVKRRVEVLLQLPHATAMLCGKDPFDLEEAIEQHKVVLFNLSDFGPDGSKDIGRLLVAYVGAIARRQGKLRPDQRRRIHLFVDESSALISDELLRHLKELRKFGLYTTLAQHAPDDGLSRSQASLLSELMGTKFLGSRNGDKSGFLRSDGDLPSLARNQFYVDCDAIDGVGLLHVRDDLVGSKNSVRDDKWQEYENWLIGEYYSEVPLEGEILPPEQEEYEEEAGIAHTPEETGTDKSTIPLKLPAWAMPRPPAASAPVSMVPPTLPAARSAPPPASIAGGKPSRLSRGRRGR